MDDKEVHDHGQEPKWDQKVLHGPGCVFTREGGDQLWHQQEVGGLRYGQETCSQSPSGGICPEDERTNDDDRNEEPEALQSQGHVHVKGDDDAICDGGRAHVPNDVKGGQDSAPGTVFGGFGATVEVKEA